MTTQTVKRIVCLANSRKLSGRCIAGKATLPDGRPGGWVRPVSDRENEEVSEYERQYEDGGDPRILDVIDVPVVSARPKNHQQENWLLDQGHYWKKVRSISRDELAQFTDSTAPLWINGHSSNKGLNDKIPFQDAESLNSSLRLIRVDKLELSVSAPGAEYGNHKRSVQCRFQHNGTDYWLRVTDPDYERKYLRVPDGAYPIGERFITVSVGEPFHGDVYKLIAAIIEP